MFYVRFLFWFVAVCGLAVVIRRAHVHVAGVLAGAVAVWSHTASPALTTARGGSVDVLQGFVFDVGVGV